MAMRQLGKLKFETKNGGLQFQWGDGEKHHLGLKKQPENLAPEEDYTDYSDRYSDEDRDYRESDFDNDAYASDDYGARPYSDEEYGEYDDGDSDNRYSDDYGAPYEDDRYEDDYDNRSDDAGYEDYEERYDDEDHNRYSSRYQDEGDSDAYDYENYQDYEDYEDYDDGRDGVMDSFFRYVDENEWLIYVLLVLLPPLGIYLLWRRGSFEPMIRYAVSAASAVWFIVLLVLLSMLIFGGHEDVEEHGALPTLNPTMAVDAEASPSVGPSPSPSAVPGGSVVIAPSATPLMPSASVQPLESPGTLVWTSATNRFYHNDQHCEMIGPNEGATQVTVENAKNRGKFACPICYDQDIYYATEGGQYYHLDKNCSDMSGAEVYTKEQAKDAGKKPCPVCVTKTQSSLVPVVDGSSEFLTSDTRDKSGIKVWCTPGGKNYHMTSGCRGMEGATQMPLRDAILMGKTACSTCCNTGNTMVYCTKNGTYYHRTEDCSGMKGASRITLAEALVLGKKECPTCKPVANAGRPSMPNVPTVDNLPSIEELPSIIHPENRPSSDRPSPTDRPSSDRPSGGETRPERPSPTRIPVFGDDPETTRPPRDDEYYVYATPNGTYYHLKEHCSHMTGAVRVPLSQMIKEGRPACPVCCSGASKTVYATPGGKFYHSYPTCSGMDHAVGGSLEKALAMGFKRCPKCWGANSGIDTNQRPEGTEVRPTAKPEGQRPSTGDSVMVYATKNGKWYHTNEHCSGMKNASKISLSTAIKYGKQACPICASGANKMVYSTEGGKYYHRLPDCSGMHNAKKRTLAEALTLGQTACPVCVNNEHSPNPEGGGVRPDGGSRPEGGGTRPDGGGARPEGGGTRPEGGGTRPDDGGTRPDGGGTRPDSGGGEHEYEAGASGIKVYASENGRYYHLDKHCSGDPNQSHITLETALNYGKEACPKCVSTAHSKVYGTPSGKYYHQSKSCAGSGAISSTLEQALARGYKPCPSCVLGHGDSQEPEITTPPDLPQPPIESTDRFKPGTSGVKVYATPSGPYYHQSKSCAGSDAQKITLETALNYGKKACPICSAFAEEKVYSVKGSKYYHSKKYCEPGVPIEGTFAEALAYGLKECPYCIGGGSGPIPEYPTPTQGPEYSAPESSSVYIDLYSDMFYYHKNSSCPGSGMKDGTEVTLEYAKDFGYKRCPYCNPPSGID